MSVATPTQPDFTSQTPTQYKTNIDGAHKVASRIAWAFAPHESSPPDMRVQVDPGHIPALGGLATEVTAQSVGPLVAPTTDPRHDIIYVDAKTGAAGVATGTEASTPADPSIPAGKIPVARVRLTAGMTAITNQDLDDLRAPELAGMSDIAHGISSLTAETSPAVDDEIAINDVSATAERKITLQNALTVIQNLVEDTNPDPNNDVLLTYDASAGDVKKVLVNNFLANGEFRSMRVFLASDTWTKPAGLRRVRVRVWGAGGGGGGGGGGGSNKEVGAGGGGGAYTEKVIEAASLGATETVTVGAGGAAGSTGNAGSAGGSSSFGGHVLAGGGGGGPAPANPGEGGVGGTAMVGDVNMDGGGGGGSTGSVTAHAGWGGAAACGGGATRSVSSAITTGYTGNFPGGGGSGGRSAAGGPGADGLVIVEEYF